MSASFAPGVCGVSTGPSTAVQVTQEQVNRLASTQQELLQQTLSALNGLDNIVFPGLSTRVSYNPDAFVDRVDRPVRPSDPSDVNYNAPTPPSETVPQVNLSEIDYDGPPFSNFLVDHLVSSLIDLLTEINTLPTQWANLLYAQARDRETNRMRALEEQTMGRWSRLGWQQPTGAETRQIDMIRKEGWDNIAEANRQIMVTQFQEALTSLRFAIGETIKYLGFWVQSAADKIQASAEANRYQIANAQILLNQLQQRVAIFQAEVQGEATRVNTELEIKQKEINLYSADISERELLVRRDVEQADNELEAENISAQLRIQENQQQLEERRRDVTQQIQLAISQADILRQVTAASFQAMNIGSGMNSNSSSSDNKSCNTNYSYNESKVVED